MVIGKNATRESSNGILPLTAAGMPPLLFLKNDTLQSIVTSDSIIHIRNGLESVAGKGK